MVAVARDERWGRTYEAFGETPELASMMGVAYINGFQKRGGPFTVLANAKHYLGDGGTANGVNTGDTSGTRRRCARCTCPLPGRRQRGRRFDHGVLQQLAGDRMHANNAMITGVLKGDLGFGGFVASDYNGCYQNGVNVAGCLKAGVDMLMTFRPAPRTFVSSVAAWFPAPSRRARIDDAARRILVAKCEMGLLDGTQHLVDRSLTAQVGSAAHRAVARRAVAASLVVLKNDGGVLPLSKDAAHVALGGKTGDNIGNQCGGWTVTWQGMTGAVSAGTTIRQAMEAVLTRAESPTRWTDRRRSGATVGVAVIGETPYSEGCGDIPSPQGGSSCISRPTALSLDAADVQVVQKMKTRRPQDSRRSGRRAPADHRQRSCRSPMLSSSRGCPGPRAPASPTCCSATSTRRASCHTAGPAAWRRSRSTWATPTTIRSSRSASA